MFFKKKQDKIRRCPEGHILDPAWTHCPYCQEPGEAPPPPAAPPSYAAGPGFAPPPGPAVPPPAAPPPIYAPPSPYPPPASPPASPAYAPPPAGGLDANVDKTVVNPRVPPPAPPAPPAPPPPALLETLPAAAEEGEDDPELSRVLRPASMPAPAAPPAAAPTSPPAPPIAAATPAAPPPAPTPPPVASPPPAPARPAAPPSPPAGADEHTRVLPRAAAARSLVAWLVVTDGDYRGRDFRLQGPRLRIGIAPDCEISLPAESYLSRHHAELELVDGDYVLRDLSSRNGTFVNDERVERCTLCDGDVVRLGLTPMIYRTLLI